MKGPMSMLSHTYTHNHTHGFSCRRNAHGGGGGEVPKKKQSTSQIAWYRAVQIY